MISKIKNPDFNIKLLKFIKEFKNRNRGILLMDRIVFISQVELDKLDATVNRNIDTVKNDIDKGLGYIINNFKHNEIEENHLCHLVILNSKLIKDLGLSEDEFFAVILHELGHIYNLPKYDPPHFTENYPEYISSLIKYKEEHKKNEEIFADYFVVQQGYKNELIKAHIKFMNSEYCKSKEDFKQRISVLKKDETTYFGSCKTLRVN
jgi:hypothetical protein